MTRYREAKAQVPNSSEEKVPNSVEVNMLERRKRVRFGLASNPETLSILGFPQRQLGRQARLGGESPTIVTRATGVESHLSRLAPPRRGQKVPTEDKP